MRESVQRPWLAFAFLLIASCDEPGRGEHAEPSFYPETPHESYEYAMRRAGLEQTALGYEWIMAGRTAMGRALPVETPYEEVGYLDPLEAGAMGFRVSAERGQLMRIEVTLESDDPSLVFLDLYRVVDDTLRPHRHEAHADSTERSLEYFVRRTGEYVLRVQPELLRGGRYRIQIIKSNSLAFPVEGRDVTSIRSVFGDPRDGGRREHHGVDIFAPRGTPVLAATDGRVRSTRRGGLGGKTVWLRDRFGQSLYYAHLDSQAVRRNQLVREGDTIGFVGNTGNARTTPPHLHFGIYRRGAYDPFPALNPLPSSPPRLTADTAVVGGWARNTIRAASVRTSPSARAPAVGTAERHAPMLVLGGAGGWYRVLLPDGSTGFVVARSLEPMREPLRNVELGEGGVLLGRPLATAAVRDSLIPGGEISVLAEFGDYLYVRPANGPTGWLPRDANVGRLASGAGVPSSADGEGGT